MRALRDLIFDSLTRPYPWVGDTFAQGFLANSILDNPYWVDYPKPSTPDDEMKARRFVDGYVQKLRSQRLRV